MSKSICEEKSFEFSVRIVKLCEHLKAHKKEYAMSNQVLRSGTSIGANISEAEYAISDKDFLSKMQIALKECSETRYWLRLLFRTGYLTEKQYESILSDCNELFRILIKITKTTSEKIESASKRK